MTDVSIVVPFYRRHANLRNVVDALTKQRDVSFEVIISTPECDDELAQICAQYDFIRIAAYESTVWNVSQCRNVGIRAASADIVLLLDADMIGCPELAARHVDAHRRATEPILAAGCALGFAPYNASDAALSLEPDARWDLVDSAPLPWAFCWSGNLSMPRAKAGQFDETFCGWGAEDLEFSYRASRSRLEVRFLRDATAIHQPHERTVDKNVAEERSNFCRFLRKHPTIYVELVVWLNDIEANRRYREIIDSVAGAGGVPCAAVGRETLRLGATTVHTDETALPILGVATPFEDRTFRHVETAGWMSALPADLREAVAREAARIGGRP